MTAQLYQLVYYSRNNVADHQGAFGAEVDSILDASRRNNQASGITGALLFNGGCFAQVLEGPLDAVEKTFERIQQDPRHGDVSLLALDPIEARTFSHWAMGFVGQSAKNADRFASVGLDSGFDIARLGGQKVHAILKELTLEEERVGG